MKIDFSSKTLKQCYEARELLKLYSGTVPPELKARIEELEKIENSDTPIFSKMVDNYKWKPYPEEKRRVVEETVAELLSDAPDAKTPGLLLGNIQCGKTDTFEQIIGLSFDKGFDVAVVLTKGTNALVDQTIKRIKRDFDMFRPTNNLRQKATVEIYDIMQIKDTLRQAEVECCKNIIVCKKEDDNLRYLDELFRKPFLENKKVLVVDDEADFCSRNYLRVRKKIQDETGKVIGSKSIDKLAKISQQIDDFCQRLENCRYLQVTATPQSLFLQPQGDIYLEDNKVLSFRPRFTKLVPVHKGYVGGDVYYNQSQNPESMYSNLYCPISEDVLVNLRQEDKRMLDISIAHKRNEDLKRALIAFFMATAIRKIQSRRRGLDYSSSALIHTETANDSHDWQSILTRDLLQEIGEVFKADNRKERRVFDDVDYAYEDYKDSNKLGHAEGLIMVEFPTKEEVITEMRKMFIDNLYVVKIINAQNDIKTNVLNEETGEFNLAKGCANIFIGGNILDRGITVTNMLCFFYGRNPKKLQQDAILQHARMYGNRSKEDMAVTRFYTTERIYDLLKATNDMDETLRAYLAAGKDQNELGAVFVCYDKDLRPCSPTKIKISDLVTIKKQQFYAPSGFWTYDNKKMAPIVKRIRDMIQYHPNYLTGRDAKGFFEMEVEEVMEILKIIKSSYVYADKYNNSDHVSDMDELMSKLIYCTDDGRSNGKVYIYYDYARDIKRITKRGDFIANPYSGSKEAKEARLKGVDAPVLILLHERGLKEIDESGVNVGWNNAEFYWPVLMTQEELDDSLFAINQKKRESEVDPESDILKGINREECLIMTYDGDTIEHFGTVEESKNFKGDVLDVENRVILPTTAGLYLERDPKHPTKFLIRDGIKLTNDLGVNSMNGGVFPFVFRPYKYMLLREGRTANVNEMLLELAPTKYWIAEPETETNFMNTTYDQDMEITSDGYLDDYCTWHIDIAVKKVLRYKEKKQKKTK